MKLSSSQIWPILIAALVLGLGAFALNLMEYRLFVRQLPAQIYVLLVAIAFLALGIWAGHRLTPHRRREKFRRNEAALKSLGISRREYEVLVLTADGQSNKQMARTLSVSPNTIKTQLASVFAKLEVRRRTEAVRKARELELIP